MIFGGESKAGQLVLDEPIRWRTFLARTKGRVRVEVKKARPIRSLDQNGYYHDVVLGYWSDFTGYDHDEMHKILKADYKHVERDLPNGRKVSCPVSTAAMDSKEFTEYVDWARRKAYDEFNVYIPLPNEPSEVML